jgi:hypothetical protein
VESAKGQTREEVINRLAERVDNFEKYSHPHSKLMAALAVALARHMGLAQSDIVAIREAALLHDVGLFAMSPSYHSSPGPLGFDERMDLWRHPVIGEQQMAKRDATRYAQLLVRWHHERWNGSGYPDSLAFEDIPIGARILYTVELYSALISDRPYRNALRTDEVIAKLKAAAGVECDPYVIKALLALLDELKESIVETGRTGVELDVLGGPPVQEQVASELQTPQPPQYFEPFVGGAQQTGTEREAQRWVFSGADEEATGQEAKVSSPQPVAPTVEGVPWQPAPDVAVSHVPSAASIISRLEAQHPVEDGAGAWRGWKSSRYNKKALLGFEASVLRQIEFKSIAIAFSGGTRLDWYLKAWGKQILSNDPRAWAAAVSKGIIEAREPLTEEQIGRLLHDVYVPGTWLRNPSLRRWFSETDAWWMDNLRRNIEAAGDETLQAEALALGLQVGDYAQSFDDETRALKRPLTTVFWQLAGRIISDPGGHRNNRVHYGPAREFILRVHADLLYLDLPAAHAEVAGSEARSQWRECWVQGKPTDDADDLLKLTTVPQSKQSYLSGVDRLLRAAAHIKTWAVGYQEVGVASAREVSDLIKEHRPVTATYSKDLTEVAGGLRNYIIVAERA